MPVMKPSINEADFEEPQNFAPLATPQVNIPLAPAPASSSRGVNPHKRSPPVLNPEADKRQNELEAGLSGDIHFKTQGNPTLAHKPFEIEPSPIMSLYNRQGVNTSTGEISFSTDSNAIVLSNKTILCLNIVNGHQRFLIGHESKVSCFTVVPQENLIVSADEGESPEVIVWRIVPARILLRFKVPMKAVHVMDSCKFTKDEK